MPQPAIELDVDALHKRLEARAKAMIQLEEQEVASRTKVKFVLKQKVGLGEVWKIVGKCPELGKMLPEVAPNMQWNNGDVWTLEAKIRPGTFIYKAVLRKPDGEYLWEDGKDRVLEPAAERLVLDSPVSSSVEEASDGEEESCRALSSDDPEPFFERLAPSVDATAPAPSSGGPPEEGSLVLGERRQYVLPAPIAKKLYPHQVQGVKWLWSLFEMQQGGILGDDMGLGKTMQCSAFLAGLFSCRLIKRAIIVAPKTLLPHWTKELSVCGLRQLTREFFGSSESERGSALRSVVQGRGVLVTTYGMVQHNAAQLAGPKYGSASEDFGWDVMLLDEGHKIKNPKMKLVEELKKLPTRINVIISGTPIQNNLMEMHSLFSFAGHDGLLGDAKAFKKNYERPITKGLDKEASARERQTGAAIAAELRKRVEPFFLRREKKDVLPDSSTEGRSAAGDSTSGRTETDGAGPSTSAGPSTEGPRAQGLPRKTDLVVWVRLTALQRKIYTAFLHTDSVRQVLNDNGSPLAAITVLKKICDHPALLSARAANNVIAGAHRRVGRIVRRVMQQFDYILAGVITREDGCSRV
ncbi:hypothetical protein GPECTOR_1g682 [Gonium pectorale]|uniref:Helicase ATP-binding domain-containing protein n=1 Tax=Gonium pectorale TaxID=33097 RepID=A0A150H3L0_GONPE|nr:hypothetical protein GPECTOR_1g682 [Gonium pectorale]|eukprot:KXZ56757.1 hypothetical protein GPECTOR_1g682 [Gonium pectorale]